MAKQVFFAGQWCKGKHICVALHSTVTQKEKAQNLTGSFLLKMQQEKLRFLKPEPEEYDKRMLKKGIQIKTRKYMAWEIEKRHYDNFNSVPKKKRQKILDYFESFECPSVADVAKKFKINFRIVVDIIYLN